jgi:hypothetical protein
MSISTYFKLNIHQNGPEILGAKVTGLAPCTLMGSKILYLSYCNDKPWRIIDFHGTGALAVDKNLRWSLASLLMTFAARQQ